MSIDASHDARVQKRVDADGAAGAIGGSFFAAGAAAGVRRAANAHLFTLVGFVFILPNAIFATALRPAMAAVVLVGCAAAAALLWRMPRGRLLSSPIDLAHLAFSLAFGLGFCLLGGEGHFFYASRDWLARDAVLSDLVSSGLRVFYEYEGKDYLLRAPLGMYLAPAMVGRAYGLYAAHLTLLAQNSILLGAMVYFISLLANVRKTPMLLLFMAFSGLDMVGVLLAEAIEMARGGPFMAFGHIEWWGEYFSAIRLQYSSHLTQLFWVPNHMAPGWWFALLALLHVRGEAQLPAILSACATMLIWSPLAMMGAAPFVAFFMLQTSLGKLFSREIFMATAVGLCFLPIALYLTMDAAEVPHGWLIFRDSFPMRYALFILLELPQAAVVLYAWNKVEPCDRRMLALALVILLALPVYSIGDSNDFVMRVSIPALFLLAYNFCRIAVLTPRDNSAFPTVISMIVILSAGTPMLEIKEALQKAYRISDCNLVTSWHKGDVTVFPANYWARVEKVPSWLISTESARPPLTLEDRQCWPDHPALPEKMK